MTFFINARYALLTYPQCGDLDGFAVMEHLATIPAECIVARENHEAGGIHLHVFVDFGRKFRSRKIDIFDVDGRHPNIQPSRGTPEKGYDYAIKDGDVICGGLERPVPSGVSNSNTRDNWARITCAGDREQFWDLCHELDPKSTVCNFGQLQKYADWKFRSDPPCYATPSGIEFSMGEMDGRYGWLQQSGVGGREPLLGKRVPFAQRRARRFGGSPSEAPPPFGGTLSPR